MVSKENVGRLLKEMGDLVAEDTDRSDGLSYFLTSVFTRKFSLNFVLSKKFQERGGPVVDEGCFGYGS